MAIVGYVTTENVCICLECAATADLVSLQVGSVYNQNNECDPIDDPAPNGLRLWNARNADCYDRACGVCGWAIRRMIEQ